MSIFSDESPIPSHPSTLMRAQLRQRDQEIESKISHTIESPNKSSGGTAQTSHKSGHREEINDHGIQSTNGYDSQHAMVVRHGHHHHDLTHGLRGIPNMDYYDGDIHYFNKEGQNIADSSLCHDVNPWMVTTNGEHKHDLPWVINTFDANMYRHHSSFPIDIPMDESYSVYRPERGTTSHQENHDIASGEIS